ncbi:MAG: hypothetical protein ABJG78_15465 [Cyclobacteriaceae bacterium]
MTDVEKVFQAIIHDLPEATQGKMFGAKSVRASNGKTAAIFWNEEMIFKLDDEGQKEALKLSGAKVGTHLYAKDRPMKGWVNIPHKHCDKWEHFASKAIEFVITL